MAEVTRISRQFKDISLSFKPHPVTGDLPVLKNERSINKSVRNIVQTVSGEKFFDSAFGSSVNGQLFELVDYANASLVEQEVRTALNNYEPRIEIVNVEVIPLAETNEFEVTIVYDIVGQAFPTQTYSFILEATR